jgi:drug/metabolite transporter (DMT)-like permease
VSGLARGVADPADGRPPRAPAPAAAGRIDRPLHGIAYILVGASVFPVQDVLIKGLSGQYAVLQIVFVRSLVALGLFACLLWREGAASASWLRRPWLHAGRGLLGLMSFTTYYMAIAALPLATVTSVAFAAPLFLTTLSALVLGERVDRRGWSAVVLGLVGVLIVLRPGAATFEPAALLAVMSALCYAISQTITRHLGRRDSGATIVFSATAVAVLVAATSGLFASGGGRAAGLHPSLAFLVRGWVMPPWGALGRMVLCGVISSVGIYCLTQAYRVAPASTVSPFEYAMIGWAVLWGYVFWGDVPGPTTLVGVATTVAAGLYVLHHQARAERERRRASAGPSPG